MSYYHYTKGCHLPKIVKDGMIKTAKIAFEKREKPAAWLTKSPEWDVACNVGIVKNTKEIAVEKDYLSDEVEIKTTDNDYMKKEIGMCRILINESLPVISWTKFRYVSGIGWTSYYILDEYSKYTSPIGKWICSFNPIPKKYWEGIEMFVDDQWVRWDEKMSIQEFVNLCLSCNSKEPETEELINGFPKKHLIAELDFIDDHKEQIIKLWEANKDKKGYIQIYITPDYKPYPCGFNFKEQRVRKSTFKSSSTFKGENMALVHFLWEATFTQYRMALAYEKEVAMDLYK